MGPPSPTLANSIAAILVDAAWCQNELFWNPNQIHTLLQHFRYLGYACEKSGEDYYQSNIK